MSPKWLDTISGVKLDGLRSQHEAYCVSSHTEAVLQRKSLFVDDSIYIYIYIYIGLVCFFPWHIHILTLLWILY